ncbi:aminotransferase class IV [Clostridium hydrogenum]|uniref:aminotransferase class IV n=1 Tax=Clostridium hydrogenum TaxID=2855764 RepID=UPI001F20544D|nr:aminotransferase class IV [Clostridium hydrogenum]
METAINNYFLFNDEVKNITQFDETFTQNGKCLYEVIRVIDGVPLFLEKHLERLENSAMISNMKLPMSKNKVKDKILQLIKVNGNEIGNVKIVFNYILDECSFYAYFVSHHYPSDKEYANGVDTVFYHGERNNPNAKIINLSFRENVDKLIRDKGVFEAILVDRNGNITEGSKSNIFMVKNTSIYTSPKSEVLPGITRDIIIEVANSLGYTVLEKKINYKEMVKMDGVFISGTSPKVLPVSKIEEEELSSANNEIIKNIHGAYDKYINEYVAKFNEA